MPGITCPSCSNESFEVNAIEMADEKDKVLILVCLKCKNPSGVIKSYESIKLMHNLEKHMKARRGKN
jgi:hypothetical protein